MSYEMCKLVIGTGKIERLFEINTDLSIGGLCHIDKFGFLFLFRDNHCIGYADDNGRVTIPWMGFLDEKGDEEGTDPHLSFPSSICYDPNLRLCFLLEYGGIRLRSIDVFHRYCGNIFFSDPFSVYFSKSNNIGSMETSCDVDRYSNLYWTVRDLHRCFKKPYVNSGVENYIGNGRSGFSISNNLNVCLFSKPSGIKCIDGSVYISDSGNHCIREVKDGVINMALGNPMNENILSVPTQLKYNNGIVYILDGQDVKYLSLNDKNNGILYTSPNIVAIEASKKGIYVLEKS
jgi:hypothetical protein